MVRHFDYSMVSAVRIDRFPDLFDSEKIGIVNFEAVIKFLDGRVEASFPAYTREGAIQAAKQLIKHYRPNDSYPPAYQQSTEKALEMWEPGYLVESSEMVSYQMLIENN